MINHQCNENDSEVKTPLFSELRHIFSAFHQYQELHPEQINLHFKFLKRNYFKYNNLHLSSGALLLSRKDFLTTLLLLLITIITTTHDHHHRYVNRNLAPVLLQLFLQLLLPPPPHHRLRVADAPRERRVRQFWGIQR